MSHAPSPRAAAGRPLHPRRALLPWATAVVLAAQLAAVAPAQAVAAYSEQWTDGLSLRDWIPGSPQTQLAPDAAVGLPAGSLAGVLVPNGSPAPSVTFNSGDAYALEGDYSGQTWVLSFDTLLSVGMADGLSLRFRTYDFPDIWYLPLAVPGAGEWAHFDVAFDADWTDDQAAAAGWLREGGPTVSFASALQAVTGVDVRWSFASTTTTALVHLDNVVLQPEGQVPVPGSAALALLGLAGVGLRRRSR